MPSTTTMNSNYVLVIHGGAGTMSREKSTPEQREAYRVTLRRALTAGYAVLSTGGEAIDAAVAAVTVMEDCPLFNAGKGAVFNMAGKNELEASIALSKPPPASIASQPIPTSRRGIGATLLTRTKNPSQLVRSLYLNPSVAPHTFLSGNNVENIGEVLGMETVDSSYYWTQKRWKEHTDGLEGSLPAYDSPSNESTLLAEKKALDDLPMDLNPKGTVGAVALDIRGCIASCTSTGGRTNKQVGRVGDTPIFGCGFWAEEWEVPKGRLRRTWEKIRRRSTPSKKAVGVSGTGDGDYFIRLNTASTLVNRVKLAGKSLDSAAQMAVDELRRDGGDGGVIALNQSGEVSMKLNCPGMYRGVVKADGVPIVAIFREDVLE